MIISIFQEYVHPQQQLYNKQKISTEKYISKLLQNIKSSNTKFELLSTN
jgi:hypothetical protein